MGRGREVNGGGRGKNGYCSAERDYGMRKEGGETGESRGEEREGKREEGEERTVRRSKRGEHAQRKGKREEGERRERGEGGRGRKKGNITVQNIPIRYALDSPLTPLHSPLVPFPSPPPSQASSGTSHS